jgi:hypothetical protein
MYFIIETKDQLDRLGLSKECFVQVITNNQKYHPKLATPSIIYYHNGSKGYCLSVDHSESFKLEYSLIFDFIKNHETVYCYDKKYHSYFLDHNNLYDLYYNQLIIDGEINKLDTETVFHAHFEQQNGHLKSLNRIIPITKHYEKYESLKEKSEKYMVKIKPTIDVTQAYKYVEESGILINNSKVQELYNIQQHKYSVQNSIAYTYYNLYNITGRPTNSFNSINFLAIPKEESFRSCFLPKNNYLVEFDFDAYHPRLIAKELNIDLPEDSLHEYFAKLYFNKNNLTKEDYKLSKEITFKQLYGGIQLEYANIEFFKKINEFCDKLWYEYNKSGKIVLPTGLVLNKEKKLNKLKLFNYYIQNLETKNNFYKINELISILANKETKLVLITYDSFLFDFSINDGKDLLIEIKNILQKDKTPVKYKYGSNYNF